MFTESVYNLPKYTWYCIYDISFRKHDFLSELPTRWLFAPKHLSVCFLQLGFLFQSRVLLTKSQNPQEHNAVSVYQPPFPPIVPLCPYHPLWYKTAAEHQLCPVVLSPVLILGWFPCFFLFLGLCLVSRCCGWRPGQERAGGVCV